MTLDLLAALFHVILIAHIILGAALAQLVVGAAMILLRLVSSAMAALELSTAETSASLTALSDALIAIIILLVASPLQEEAIAVIT
jgi:hypothetical protein